MSDENDQEPIAVSIAIGVSTLADRVVAALANAPGVRLVGADETADFVLTPTGLARAGVDQDSLTPRELEVLSLMATGASNKAIARALGISTHTAKFHVGSVLDKLDATGRTDAVAHAARLGILRL